MNKKNKSKKSTKQYKNVKELATSVTKNGYTLIYDCNDNYYLFEEDELIETIKEENKPDKVFKLVEAKPLTEIEEIKNNNLINILKTKLETLGNKTEEVNTLKDLLNTLKQSYTNKKKNEQFTINLSDEIKSFIIKKSLECDFDNVLLRLERMKQNVNYGGDYLITPDGVYFVMGIGERQKKILVMNETIKDFRVKEYTNTVIPPKIELETGKKCYKGHMKDVINMLHNEGVVGTKTSAENILNMLNFWNKDKHTLTTDGGYLKLSEITTDKPKLEIHPQITELIQAMDNTQLYALKNLLILPFCNILREEAVVSRGNIKALLFYGAKGTGKTFIINLVINMFTEDNIGLTNGGCPQTAVALRNSLANTVGIVMCDESDDKLIDLKRRVFHADVENIIKGVYQTELPKVSNLNNQGHLLQQTQHGVPVFTMNNKIYTTEALNDRLITIKFDNNPKLPITDLKEIKQSLLSIGGALSYCFKQKWEEIRTLENTEEIINTLLNSFQEEYNINIEHIIKSEYTDTDNYEQSITDLIRQNIIQELSQKHRIINNNVAGALNTHYVIFDWILDIRKRNNEAETIIIHSAKFHEYIMSPLILSDGGISTIRIKERLQAETDITWESVNRKVKGTQYNAYEIEWDLFCSMFNLGYGDKK